MGNKWLSVKPSPNPKQRLVCIPYAGQSAAVFDDWSAALPDHVEVCAVELPGRRRRYKEPHVADVTTAAQEVELALRSLPPMPTALFGHSMGALIAFELSLCWNRRTGPLELLVVSGCRAPHLKRREQPIHALPREDFLAALAALGGTPPELLQNEQLMRVVEPVLRADLRLVETYAPRIERPLEVPLRVLGGEDDPTVSFDALAGWLRYSTRESAIQMFPGHHFFIHSSHAPLLAWLKGQLAQVRTRADVRQAPPYLQERA